MEEALQLTWYLEALWISVFVPHLNICTFGKSGLLEILEDVPVYVSHG